MIKNIMSVHKNKILLLKLYLLCSSYQLIQAYQNDKSVQSQSNYSEDDLYNHNVMNGSHFDNRPFQNKEEKYNFIAHDFKHIHVKTDIDDELLFMLVQSNYSRQQLYRLMHVAQKVAKNEDSQEVNLKHLERGYAYIEGNLDEINLDSHSNKDLQITAHHEAGHALKLVSKDTGKSLDWASIQSNKTADGYVQMSSNAKQRTEYQLKNLISMVLAGGIAEQ